MQDVSHLLDMYRCALIDMWKNYYAPQNDPAMVEQFEAFDHHLFYAMVDWPLDAIHHGTSVRYDVPYGRRYRQIEGNNYELIMEPTPYLRVLPRTDYTCRKLRITWLTPGADGAPPTRTTERLRPVSIDLRLIEIIKYEADFNFYRCRVVSYAGDETKQGLDALIEHHCVRVIYDPLMGPLDSGVSE